MTYCGAEISYGRGNCAFPFVMSSWHHMEEKKKNTPVCYVTSFFFFLSCYFIFQLLRKTNKSSQILPIYSLPVHRPGASFFFFFPKFIRVCKWRCVSFNRRVSHVTRAEGSKGTQGGGGGGGGGSSATDEEGGGGDLHLPPSAVRASRSLHNGNSPMDFFFSLFSWTKTR